MGILDMLLGNNTLDDKTIASDLLKDSKFAVFSLAKALTETANPGLRQLLTNQLITSVQQHHQLSDLLISKDWYKPFLVPEEQLAEDLQSAEKVIQ